jgi:hypothetical protein
MQYIKWAGLRSKDQYWNSTKALDLTKAHIRKVTPAMQWRHNHYLCGAGRCAACSCRQSADMMLSANVAPAMTAGTWHCANIVQCQTQGQQWDARFKCDACWLQILTRKNVFNGNVYMEEPAIFACETHVQAGCITHEHTHAMLTAYVRKLMMQCI